jgi:hypothetical protein
VPAGWQPLHPPYPPVNRPRRPKVREDPRGRIRGGRRQESAGSSSNNSSQILPGSSVRGSAGRRRSPVHPESHNSMLVVCRQYDYSTLTPPHQAQIPQLALFRVSDRFLSTSPVASDEERPLALALPAPAWHDCSWRITPDGRAEAKIDEMARGCESHGIDVPGIAATGSSVVVDCVSPATLKSPHA